LLTLATILALLQVPLSSGAAAAAGTFQAAGSPVAAVKAAAPQSFSETVLYNFTGGPAGQDPYDGVLRDANGNLYGTTWGGGTNTYGVVYKVDSSGTETVLHSFIGGASDGAYPNASVLRDTAGNLYGTTSYGGSLTCNCGVVFEISPKGKETVLHVFSGTDGEVPYAGLIRDGAGNLYGTAAYGGTYGAGVVFKLDSSGNETILHTFSYGTTDGAFPYGTLIRDAAGNLYGTTENGGSGGGGIVFKLDPSGNETVLHNFAGGASDGATPRSALIRDAAGNLYGTTQLGGRANFGTIFRLDPTGHFTLLHSFAGADGSLPYAGLTRDSAGNLYGTTYQGGDFSCAAYGCGVIFQVNHSGQFSVIHTFTGFTDGAYPEAGLTVDSAGNLYGTTSWGGSSYSGTVFELQQS
jgi:uncharacterized repeat protein (TIGR03803 family)